MSPDLAGALLSALDDEVLVVLAERLRPYLADPRADELLDSKAAAARLGLHERTVVRMAREGRISDAIKIGRSWRFPADRLTLRPATRSAAYVDRAGRFGDRTRSEMLVARSVKAVSMRSQDKAAPARLQPPGAQHQEVSLMRVHRTPEGAAS